jgi:hypothetical protein
MTMNGITHDEVRRAPGVIPAPTVRELLARHCSATLKAADIG